MCLIRGTLEEQYGPEGQMQHLHTPLSGTVVRAGGLILLIII